MRHFNLRTLFFFLFISLTSFAFAQGRTFLVKEVGDKPVVRYQGKQKFRVASCDTLSLTTMINIPKGGRLVVYDNDKLCELTITEPGLDVLGRFLSKSSKERFTLVTFAGLIAQLFLGKEQKEAIATIYRGMHESDSETNSLNEHLASIDSALSKPIAELPANYAKILREVQKDIQSKIEELNDSVSSKKE